ncbi:uncharacterized protein C2orf81 homolog [Genypterus blacodes]|uniref:uncharacterized protein C2orf81 homolog n=1 Tax=Genypterus blacodes TaxID=154954 RepID=UPI003F773231
MDAFSYLQGLVSKDPEQMNYPQGTTQGKGVEVFVPGCISQAQWRNMLIQDDTEETVGEIMAEVWAAVMEGCLKDDVKRQLVPYSASWARNYLFHLLEWQFIYQDEGDGPQEASGTEDSEPAAATLDAWAQGCVPVANATPTSTTCPSTYREVTPNGRLTVMTRESSSPKQSEKEKSPSKPGDNKNYRGPPLPKRDPKTKPQSQRELTLPLSSSAEEPGHLAHASSTLKQSEKETSPRVPGGDQSNRHLCPLPPLKSAQKKPQSRVPPKGVVEKCSVSLPSSSKTLGRQEAKAKNTTSAVPLYRRKEQPIQKLDPSSLPRYNVTPQYEILETTYSKLLAKRLNGFAKPQQRNNKQKTGLTVNSPKLLLSPSGHRREGIVPFSDSVRLDTVHLAPGVSLHDSQAIQFDPNKLCPPVQSTRLRPIQNDAGVPQVSGLRSPQVTPMFHS